MKIIISILLFVMLISFISYGLASSFNSTMENDLIAETDRHYTHGTRVSYVFDDTVIWPESIYKNSQKVDGIALAQHMYTPSDIKIEEMMENDRPYGGWLYVGSFLTARNDNWLDYLELDIGITGPASLSESTQKFVHEIVDSAEPMGWDYQIPTRFGINLVYQKKYRVRYKDYVDLIPHGGGCLGNTFSYVNAGCIFRGGYNLPDNFGAVKMEPTARTFKDDCGIYVFGGVESRYMAKNIFLDDKYVKENFNITKEDFVYDFEIGIGVIYGRYEIIYGYTIRTEEYEEQEGRARFGTLICTTSF